MALFLISHPHRGRKNTQESIKLIIEKHGNSTPLRAAIAGLNELVTFEESRIPVRVVYSCGMYIIQSLVRNYVR